MGGSPHLPDKSCCKDSKGFQEQGGSAQNEVTVVCVGGGGGSRRLNPGFLPSFPGVTVKQYCSKCYKKKRLKALKTFEGSFRF